MDRAIPLHSPCACLTCKGQPLPLLVPYFFDGYRSDTPSDYQSLRRNILADSSHYASLRITYISVNFELVQWQRSKPALRKSFFLILSNLPVVLQVLTRRLSLPRLMPG